jgi:hypothetical protein
MSTKQNQSNTSDIDKKKKEIQPDKNLSYENTYNYGSFLFRQFITLGITIIVGTGIVYGSKAYQGNIIPVDTHYFPYTNVKNPKLRDMKVQTNSINIIKTDNKQIYSTHIDFPFDENNKTIDKGLLGYFRKIKNKNVYFMYLFTVLQDTLTTNLSFNGTLYKFLNSVFTESINIFISPLLFLCWCVLLFFINLANIIISLIKNLNLLFSIDENKKSGSLFWFLNFFNRKNDIDDEDKPPKWKKGSMFSSLTNIMIGFVYIYVIWLFTLFFGFFIVYPLVSLFCIIYCFILPLSMNAKNVKNINKPTDYSFKNALLDVLKYKSQVIMLIIAFIIMSGTYKYFGNILLLISFVVFLIMFFFTPIFEKYKLNIKDNLLPGAPIPIPPDDFGSDLIDEPVTSEKNVVESNETSSSRPPPGQEPTPPPGEEPTPSPGEEPTPPPGQEPTPPPVESNEQPPTVPKKKSSYKHKWFS